MEHELITQFPTGFNGIIILVPDVQKHTNDPFRLVSLVEIVCQVDLLNPEIADTVSQLVKLCKKVKNFQYVSGRAS